MSKCVLLYVSSVVASSTGYVCIPALLSTGGCLCIIISEVVVIRIDRNGLLSGKSFSTSGAYYAVSKSGLGTSRSFSGNGLLGVVTALNKTIASVFESYYIAILTGNNVLHKAFGSHQSSVSIGKNNATLKLESSLNNNGTFNDKVHVVGNGKGCVCCNSQSGTGLNDSGVNADRNLAALYSNVTITTNRNSCVGSNIESIACCDQSLTVNGLKRTTAELHGAYDITGEGNAGLQLDGKIPLSEIILTVNGKVNTLPKGDS